MRKAYSPAPARRSVRNHGNRAAILTAIAVLLASCASKRGPQPAHVEVADAQTYIEQALPANIAARSAWVQDIYEGFRAQSIEPTRSNVCAVVAVIAQESSFAVNPVIPGLPSIAWKEIRTRASHAGVPWLLVHGALDLTSPNGHSYAERIDQAKTERDLSDIFEDFIGAVPLGRTLFEDRNPIRTRGPMQVNVAFVKNAPAADRYPYPVKSSLAEELFTRRGSVYFGIAHLLGYRAPYDRYLYRFADYNAGQYASRNAAFQAAVARISGVHLATDGALLPHDAGQQPGATEAALTRSASRLDLDPGEIHRALGEGKSADFERTTLYARVFEVAEKSAGHVLPRALIPAIRLQGPKITRNLSTDWYAHRVDGRYRACLGPSR